MTATEFLTTFQKHLRVADPQRTSIIGEMQEHLAELEPGQDPITVLGEPRRLAAAENRTHIGVLGSKRYLLSLPWIITVAIMAILSGPNVLPVQWNNTTVPVIGGVLALAIFFGISGWTGIALRRTHRTGFALGGLALMSVLAAMMTMLVMSHGTTAMSWRESFVSLLYFSLLVTTFAAGTALGVGYFVRPFTGLKKSHPAAQAFLEAFTGIFALIVIWYLGGVLVGTVASTFSVGLASHSDYPWYRDLALWASTGGAYVIAGVFVVPIVGRHLYRRYQHYKPA